MSAVDQASIWSHWRTPIGGSEWGPLGFWKMRSPLCSVIIRMRNSSWVSTRPHRLNTRIQGTKQLCSPHCSPRTGSDLTNKPRRLCPAPPHHQANAVCWDWVQPGLKTWASCTWLTLQPACSCHMATPPSAHTYDPRESSPDQLTVEKKLEPDLQVALRNMLSSHSKEPLWHLNSPQGQPWRTSEKANHPEDRTSSCMFWPLFPREERNRGKHPK